MISKSEDPIEKLTAMIDGVDFTRYNEEIEKNPLERYINTPFFRNNALLIQKLDELYRSTGDENVLFLMHAKNISQFHYSYYKNFADYFVKVHNYGAADYILRKGIRMDCYRKQVLADMLKGLPNTCSVAGENTKKVFKRKSIVLFGREWVNRDQNYVFGSVVHFNGQCYGLMERKACDYIKDLGARYTS